jgi:hypothetical protein
MKTFPVLCLALLLATICCARADLIEMQNGDRYNGKVLAMTNAMLVLQSEILGTVTLPRERVSQINLGDAPRATSAKPMSTQAGTMQKKTSLPPAGRAAIGTTNSPATNTATADQSKLIGQVQDQFLTGAGPEATGKYQEMVNGFLTGQLSVADIRSQAKSAADQLRAAKKDLGEDAGLALDGYLAILDSFLKETASDSGKP